MSAQQVNLECVVIENGTDPNGIYSYSTDLASLENCEPIVLNVKFWGVNYPNGVNDFPNRPNDALKAIANLNILYNQFGIYFKFRGYDAFNSPVILGDPTGYYVLETTTQFSGLVNWAAANGYKDANALNVYAYGWSTGFGGIAYKPGFVSGVNSGPNGLGGNTLLHEISHNLNLAHTRSFSENTTRDPNNQYFNATTAGDEIVDTNANSGFYHSSCGCTPYINPLDCTYFGTETDNSPLNVPYDISHLDVINLLGDAYGECLEPYLTPGQGIHVREKIATGYYSVVETDLASLYEPYSGGYYGDGSSEPSPPLFQPGFNYKFFKCSCDCPLPSDYNDTSFSYSNQIVLSISKYETNYNLIAHPNHSAIYIDIPMCEEPHVRRCYDNSNLKPKSGSVTRFNDGIINANVTITPKDLSGSIILF